MAKTLSKINVQTGEVVEAHHISQSIDAFTGTEAYDITLSGSFTLTGSLKIDSLGTGVPSKSLTLTSTGEVVTGSYTPSNAILWETGSAGSYSIKAINDSSLDSTGDYSYAEGNNTLSSGFISHAEGRNTTSSGNYSHAEGINTKATGDQSHAEGSATIASGTTSHAEGLVTRANGNYSHSEGYLTIASGSSSHAGGKSSEARGENSFIHSSGSLITGTNSAVLGGQGITGSANNTVYVPNLVTTGSLTVANEYTLPTVDGTSSQVLTTDGAGNTSWSTVDTSIPQSSIIYVDSENGVDSTGRGNINEPYLTPEYALADITNTGTVTANTATNTTLSAISDVDNASLEIGMYISGTGIPFGTIIVAKGNEGGDANTVTLSKSTTATASGLTLNWIKIYILELNGNFITTGSIFKEGIYPKNNGSISHSTVTLFNIGGNIFSTPYKILGNGNYFGLDISSGFIQCSNTQPSGFTLDIEFGNIYSNFTSYVFNINIGVNINTYLKINGQYVNARFGRTGSFTADNTSIDFNSYGLISGLSFAISNESVLLRGKHETPLAVFVITGGYYINSTADLIGSTTWTGFSSHRGLCKGSVHNIGGSSNIQFLDRSSGAVTCNGGTSDVTFTAGNVMTLTVNNNVTVNVYGSAYVIDTNNGTVNNFGQTSNGSGQLTGNGVTNNYGVLLVNDSNSFAGTLNNYGRAQFGKIGNGANVYTCNNYGRFETSRYGIGINMSAGFTFINYGTVESINTFTNAAAMITLPSANCVFDNYGRIINNETDVADAVIEKTNGTLYLRQGSYIKQSNGLSPIRCTANTPASQDVYYFGVTTNCDGTTYGLSFAFDGGTFAPNDLVGGTLYENINY
jgi:hypothetical protein